MDLGEGLSQCVFICTSSNGYIVYPLFLCFALGCLFNWPIEIGCLSLLVRAAKDQALTLTTPAHHLPFSTQWQEKSKAGGEHCLHYARLLGDIEETGLT